MSNGYKFKEGSATRIAPDDILVGDCVLCEVSIDETDPPGGVLLHAMFDNYGNRVEMDICRACLKVLQQVAAPQQPPEGPDWEAIADELFTRLKSHDFYDKRHHKAWDRYHAAKRQQRGT